MKATKKILSVTLALVMAVVALAMPIGAAGAVAPLVIVDGFASTKLYKNVGTADEELVFSEDILGELIKNVGMAFIKGWISYGTADKDYAAFAAQFLPVVNKYLEPIGFNPDGTPVDATVGFHQQTEPMSAYSGEEADFGKIAIEYAELYGEDYVYNFRYDWRLSPVENGILLNDFIDTVKYQTGSQQVNIVAISLGSNVVLSYLDYFGGTSVNNLTFVSPAWQGTGLAGSIATGDIAINAFTLENFLVQAANGSFTTHATAFALAFMATYEDLTHEYIEDIDEVVQGIVPELYPNTVYPLISGMPAFWALVPEEDYEAGKANIYKDNAIDADYEILIDEYNDIQGRAKAIIDSAMAQGMCFSIAAGYNCQMYPVNEDYESTDTVIETKYMTGGATCANYMQAHDDWGTVYSQKINDGHNHLSWDAKVDASTGMYPDYTWYFKNMQHMDFNKKKDNGEYYNNGLAEFIVWLVSFDGQPTVYTDTAEHPQFVLYNTYKRKVTPIQPKAVIGDLDYTGVVTTLDAIEALRISSSQVIPTEEQLVLADLDEDGTISAEDARQILLIAIGVI